MNFFISKAIASTNTLSQDNSYFMLIVFSIFIIFFYVFSILPNQKKNKNHIKLIKSIKIGDIILMNNGLLGKIFSIVNDQYVCILINNSNKIFIKKDIIVEIVPKNIIENFLK